MTNAKNITILKSLQTNGTPIYKAYELKNGVGYFTHQLSTNISALVEEVESEQPKPVVTFDDASRLDFYRSI